ncbi:MAG: hypothetical protein ACKVVT_15735 [Dehalococcoidia bacterium]
MRFDFLVDSASPITVVSPADWYRYPAFGRLLDEAAEQRVQTRSGVSRAWDIPAMLGMDTADERHLLMLPIAVVAPGQMDDDAPSRLGRDVLNQCLVVAHARDQTLLIEPIEWDIQTPRLGSP